MTRLHYWLHAQTQYNLHSPFLFEMYREVLFAQLSPEERRRHGIPRHNRFRQLIFKCCDHYRLRETLLSPSLSLLSSLPSHDNATPPALSLLVVDHPHASPDDERRWQQLKNNPDHQVSLDLYDVALLIRNPRLSRQHLLLR